MGRLSVAMESYLEAVYELSRQDVGARVTDIAAHVGVSKASTNHAMSVLASKGLIENKKYYEIRLTPEGRRQAEFLCSKHAVIKRFFQLTLALGDEVADKDACAIEHIISNEAVEAMDAYMKAQEE